MAPSARQPSQRQVAHVLQPLAPDRLAGEQLVVPGQLAADLLHDGQDVLFEAVREVLREAARADERVVHAQAGEPLQQVQQVLALAEPVGHAGEGAELHAAGGQRHQVRGDPVDLHQHDAALLGPPWRFDAQQLLDAEAVAGLGEERREVVRTRHERDALGPGAVLAVLLDAGVQVADHRPGLGDRLPFELEHQPQHPVRGRVLGAHVHDDAVVVLLVDEAVPVAAGDGVDRALGSEPFFGRGGHE